MVPFFPYRRHSWNCRDVGHKWKCTLKVHLTKTVSTGDNFLSFECILLTSNQLISCLCVQILPLWLAILHYFYLSICFPFLFFSYCFQSLSLLRFFHYLSLTLTLCFSVCFSVPLCLSLYLSIYLSPSLCLCLSLSLSISHPLSYSRTYSLTLSPSISLFLSFFPLSFFLSLFLSPSFSLSLSPSFSRCQWEKIYKSRAGTSKNRRLHRCSNRKCREFKEH